MINESKKLKALDFNPDDQLLFRYIFILSNIRDFCHTIAPFILLSHFKNASPYEEFMILFFSALSKGKPSDRQGIFGSGRESMFFFFTRSENYGVCTLLEYMNSVHYIVLTPSVIQWSDII